MKKEELNREKRSDFVRAAVLRTLNDPKLYMAKGEDGWSVTDFMRSKTTVDFVARSILDGAKLSGERAMSGEYRGPKTIRLQVLTRQACQADKDGRPINSSKLFAISEYDAGRPEANTPPEEGDFVLVKIGVREKDDNGDDMIARRIEAFEMAHAHDDFVWRSGLRNLYAEYQVDACGCIEVDTSIAMHLLSRFGERVVLPAFAKTNVPEEPGKTRRKITNWRFREVAAGEKLPPLKAEVVARKGKRAKVESEAPEEPLSLPAEDVEG